MELGNLISDAKGKGSRPTSRDRNTDALIRLRPPHSSDEVDVMSMERRERPSQLSLANRKREEPIYSMEGRQVFLRWTSRVTRECQARFCEGFAVKLPLSTR